MVKILFTADIQVKNRDKSLFKGQEKTLIEIENKLQESKAEIYVAAGDFWEYPAPNDSERKLIYNHFARVLSIDSVKEVVLMAGNHDLEKDKKQLDTQIGFNPINIFADFVDNLDAKLSSKITYLQESKSYLSKCSDIEWIAYSLEDEEKWRPLDGITKRHPELTSSLYDEINNKFRISIYHDILRDYVDETKLPIRKEKYNNILGINDFVSELILAGDIHVNYKCKTLEGRTFMYPGSPIQHTHNEGTYITIKETSSNCNPADVKSVKLITIDETNKTWTSEDLNLINQICYNTIIFDNVSPAHALENLKLQLDNIKFGEEQTYIKVKLSNILLSKEIDINCCLQTLGMNHKRVQISFSYDKFIDLSKSFNQEIINEIRTEVQNETNINKSEEDSDVNQEKTINDLVLDNVKLNKLFTKVLDNYIPNIKNELNSEITEEDIRKMIVNLFDEQLSIASTNTQKYNIVFENIETNGFMKLGPNLIDLNIPGIVRIAGTNGIGKTTLFIMLRWLLKDEAFEGLKKNTKNKNTLIIFNDKKPEEDTVFVKSFFYVNKTPVVVTRTAIRTWKKGIDLKLKQSLHWKDYISGVEKSLNLMIIKDGKEINYTGEQAERAINLWFGNTINTILFLNQPKIENILNLGSMELKELILNYIGVDYLEKLENNLELIKSEYNLPRPKRDKESIREAIIDQKIKIEKFFDTINNAKLCIQETQTTSDLWKVNKQQIIDKQISIGNIEELISNTKKDIDDKNVEFDNFEIQIVKDKIPFEIQKPIEPKLDTIKKEIEDCLIKQTSIKNLISDNEINLSSKYDILIDTIDKRINDITLDYDNTISKENILLTSLNSEKDVQFELIQNKLSTVVNALELNKQKIVNVLQQHNSDKRKLIDDIKILENQIKSGVCKECGKPIANDWEIHKNVYITNLDKKKKEFIALEEEIINVKMQLDNLNTLVSTYRNYYEISLRKIVKNDYTENTKVIDYVNDCTAIIGDINTKISECSNRIDLLNNQKTTKYSNLNNIKYIVVSKNINKIKDIKEQLILQLGDNFNVLFDNISKHDFEIIILSDKLELLISENTERRNIIETLNTTYINELKEYQISYDENVKENNGIELYNNGVEKHNQQKNIIENQILVLKNSLLNYETKLPMWETLTKELVNVNDKLEECNKNIHEAQNTLNETELISNTESLKLDNLNTEYNNYIEYQKKNIIWKIYSNLIKSSFKDIVFEYYRSFLNNTLNEVLEDVNFKLMWNNDGELYMIDFQDGFASYRPVQQTSGMETCFLGLTLIKAIHSLNIKNSISNIFIDELSGQLNKGENLNYSAADYQELFVMLLQKFNDKTLMVVDHNIKNLFESMTYEVQPAEGGSKYVKII